MATKKTVKAVKKVVKPITAITVGELERLLDEREMGVIVLRLRKDRKLKITGKHVYGKKTFPVKSPKALLARLANYGLVAEDVENIGMVNDAPLDTVN